MTFASAVDLLFDEASVPGQMVLKKPTSMQAFSTKNYRKINNLYEIWNI
jgi:hypothetical protein